MWNKPVDSDLQQHDQCSTDILPDLRVFICSQRKQTLLNHRKTGQSLNTAVGRTFIHCKYIKICIVSYLNKGVDIVHQSLSSTNDELVYTSNSVRSVETENIKLQKPHL